MGAGRERRRKGKLGEGEEGKAKTQVGEELIRSRDEKQQETLWHFWKSRKWK